MNTETDNSLLLRWHGQRDARAFHEITRRYAPMVFATCKRILRDGAEAEDLTQECFLFLAQQCKRPPDCVPAWLHVVAVRRSLSRLRASGRRAVRERAFARERGDRLEPDLNHLLGDVDEALADLPDSLRVPLVLHFLEQRGQDEIAAQLGVAQSTISRRLDKGIAKLRAHLERKHPAVTALALAACLRETVQAEAPASLTAALGKIALAGDTAALSGAAGLSAAKMVVLAGGIVMKKIVVAAIGIAAVALFVAWALPKDDTTPTQARVAPTEVAAQDSGGSAAITASAVTAVSPSTPETPVPDTEKLATLQSGGLILGRVLDAVTREGLSGVVITARWGKEGDPTGEAGEVKSDPSDAEGNYRIAGLIGPAGIRYEVARDTPQGYRRPTYSERRGVVMDDSGRVSDVDFLLRQEAPLSGTVVDQANRPVAGASVMIGGGRDVFISEKATTDAVGAFSFQTLPPTEDLSIVATKGTELASEPYTFALPDIGITDLVLVAAAACNVSGRVVDSAGKPLAGQRVAYVQVPNSRTGTGSTETTGADGRFKIAGLAAGAYELIAFKVEMIHSGSEQKGFPIELEPGQQLTDITLVYGRDLAIAGRVTNSAGEPVENVPVGASSGFHGGSDATTDSTGRFTIENLEPGDYQINAGPVEGYQYLTLGGVPAGTMDLEIVLPEPFAVTGRVLDAQTSQPISEFEIVLGLNWGEGLNSRMSTQFQKVSNPEGRFELSQSQPYQSMLAARAPGYATAMRALDLTGPPYTREVDLKLERGQDLTGRVVDAQGLPVANASIYWGKIAAAKGQDATQSAADGSFTLASFPSDPQLISAYHPSYAPASVVVQGTARFQPFEFVLTEGGTVEGTVAFADGIDPVACHVGIGYPEAHYIPEMTSDVASDGTYRIGHVPPGELKVLLRVGIDFPSEDPALLWQDVSVQPGGTATVDFEVRPATGGLEGVLRYPQGALPSRVILTIECTTDAGIVSRMEQVAPGGRFHFEGLPAGPAELKIDANFQNHRRIATSVFVEVTEGDGASVEVPL